MKRALSTLALALALAAIPSAEKTPAPFLMPVDDVFSIAGRGTVITGRIHRGSVKTGDSLDLIGLGKNRRVSVRSIERFRKTLDRAEAGEDCGLLLGGVDKNEVERGQVLAAVDSIQAHSDFAGEVDWLPASEGGRSRPASSPYRTQIYFYTSATSAQVEFSGPAAPGDRGTPVQVHLTQPVALEAGQAFALHEGRNRIATGRVLRISP